MRLLSVAIAAFLNVVAGSVTTSCACAARNPTARTPNAAKIKERRTITTLPPFSGLPPRAQIIRRTANRCAAGLASAEHPGQPHVHRRRFGIAEPLAAGEQLFERV